MDNIRIFTLRGDSLGSKAKMPSGEQYGNTVTEEDIYELDRRASLMRKYYWFLKNYYIQHSIYTEIDKYRKKLGIEVFVGVFSGILPLVFYLNDKRRRISVIFSDMDSWFSEVHSDMKKLWYRKYYSFNYALENSDCVDFLSPYIMHGVRERGIKLKEGSIFVAPCSFADYSVCIPGRKKNIEIAFCARLEFQKNPFIYLHAAREVLKIHKGVKFHLLGEGVLADEIRNFIISNNLSQSINFRFHRNPPEVFAETSIFVSIQSNTNYPSQSLLEAMACENAIIASDVGDTRLLINQENGSLITLNEKNLERQMIALIENRRLALRLGANARASVIHQHTIEKYTDYFLELLTKYYNNSNAY
jgi:glycosyltransferase involved in cell wall biosynthesis